MISKQTLRLNGGILSMVMGICLIITLITSSLILLGYYFRIQHLQITIQQRLRHHVDSGLARVLSSSETVNYHTYQALDLFGDSKDTVWVKYTFWGLYDLIEVLAKHNKQVEYSLFLKAYQPDTLGSAVLYLVDDQRPLSLAGDTRIKGTVYLPPAGVRSTYINRKGFTRNQLIDGISKVSAKELPNLNQARLNQLQVLAQGKEAYLKNMDDNLELDSLLDYTDQFELKMSHSINEVIIADQKLSYEWIFSDTLIVVESQASINGAILVAPRIQIQEGFKGTLQALASDSILVEDKVTLNYPSGLYVLAKSDTCGIKIGVDSRIDGTVLLYGPKQELRNKMISIGAHSQIRGAIYCDGLLDSQGHVFGHIATRKFYLKVNSSIFENHLFDVQLLSDTIGMPTRSDLWGASKKSGVAVWVKR